VRRLDGAGGTYRVREPWPEPVVPTLYREICEGPYDIVAEYSNACHGVPRDEVRPLKVPLAVLERWAEQLEAAAASG
jgi:hypothetical protein